MEMDEFHGINVFDAVFRDILHFLLFQTIDNHFLGHQIAQRFENPNYP